MKAVTDKQKSVTDSGGFSTNRQEKKYNSTYKYNYRNEKQA